MLIGWLSRPTPAVAALLMAITSLCWSGNFVVGRWAAGRIPPLTLSCLRWVLASLVMLALCAPYLKRDWPAVRAHWGLMVLFALTGAGFFNALQYMALGFTTATSAAVINSSAPVLIAISCFLLFGDRVGARQAVGIGVSLAGVLIVIGRGSPAALAGLGLNIGDLLMLMAMVIASVYAAYMRKKPAVHPLTFAFVTFAISGVANMPLMAGELAMGAHVEVSGSTLLAVAYVAIVPSVIAYLCFNRGIEILGGARAGVFLHLIPLFTSVLAMLLLGERPQVFHAIGFALILAGIWVATRRTEA
jgi:drug/metabolite transporter (DMT)-like permease